MSHILTSTDLDAFRTTDGYVVFRHVAGSQDGLWRYGDGTLELTSKNGGTKYVIALPSAIECRDNGAFILDSTWDALACALAHSEHEDWGVVSEFLREGDVIALKWQRGTGALELLDRLFLEVTRGDRRFRLHISALVLANATRFVRTKDERYYGLSETTKELLEVG